jgi:aspartate carbamoyltransferase catalytic subunit
MDLELNDFLSLDDAERGALASGRGSLCASQYGRPELDRLCVLADACRSVHRTPQGRELIGSLLRHRPVLNFFVQPSSRTFLSFNSAEALLGMSRMSVRDVAISSMSKGESLVDTIRTFLSYVDLVVMRHPDNDAAATAMWVASRAHRRVRLDDGSHIPVPIISGGSGTREHPTQALLDVYTLQRSLPGGIEGKRLLLVGDLARGRTVRSLAQLMRGYPGVELVFAAPERYHMKEDILAYLDAHGVRWTTADSLDEAVEEADAIYMTRIQDEHGGKAAGGGHVPTPDGFRFGVPHLHRMKPHAVLLHPLPKRDEVDPAIDDLRDDRVGYWRQERNGMWIRMALIADLFRVGGRILEAAEAD